MLTKNVTDLLDITNQLKSSKQDQSLPLPAVFDLFPMPPHRKKVAGSHPNEPEQEDEQQHIIEEQHQSVPEETGIHHLFDPNFSAMPLFSSATNPHNFSQYFPQFNAPYELGQQPQQVHTPSEEIETHSAKRQRKQSLHAAQLATSFAAQQYSQNQLPQQQQQQQQQQRASLSPLDPEHFFSPSFSFPNLSNVQTAPNFSPYSQLQNVATYPNFLGMPNISQLQNFQQQQSETSHNPPQQQQQQQSLKDLGLQIKSESHGELVSKKRINSWTTVEEAILLGVVVAKYLAHGSLFTTPTSLSTQKQPQQQQQQSYQNFPATEQLQTESPHLFQSNVPFSEQLFFPTKTDNFALKTAQSFPSFSNLSAQQTLNITQKSKPKSQSAKELLKTSSVSVSPLKHSVFSPKSGKSLALEECWNDIKTGFDIAAKTYSNISGFSVSCDRSSQALARHYKVMKTRLKFNATLEQQDRIKNENAIEAVSEFHGLFEKWRSEINTRHRVLDGDFFAILQLKKEASINFLNKNTQQTEPENPFQEVKTETEPMSSLTSLGSLGHNFYPVSDLQNTQIFAPQHTQAQTFPSLQQINRQQSQASVFSRSPSQTGSVTQTQRVNSWTQHEEIILLGVVVERFISRGSLVSARKSTSKTVKNKPKDSLKKAPKKNKLKIFLENEDSEDILESIEEEEEGSETDTDCWSVIKTKFDLAWSRFLRLTQSEQLFFQQNINNNNLNLSNQQTSLFTQSIGINNRSVNALARHYKVMRARVQQQYETDFQSGFLQQTQQSGSNSAFCFENRENRVLKLWEMFDVWRDVYNKDGVLLSANEL